MHDRARDESSTAVPGAPQDGWRLEEEVREVHARTDAFPAWLRHFMKVRRRPDQEGPWARLYKFRPREVVRFPELSGEYGGILTTWGVEDHVDWSAVDQGDPAAVDGLSAEVLDEEVVLESAGMLFWNQNEDAQGEVIFRKVTDVLDFRLVRIANKVLSMEDHVDGGPFEGYDRMHVYETVEQALNEHSTFSVDGPLEEVECSVCPTEEVARRLEWEIEREAQTRLSVSHCSASERAGPCARSR